MQVTFCSLIAWRPVHNLQNLRHRPLTLLTRRRILGSGGRGWASVAILEVGMESQRDSFGMRNFGNLDLGDKRRTARLVDTVDNMCRHPGGTLPDKLNRPADLRGFYRLVRRPEVTHETVIRSHADYSRARIAEQ